LQNCYIVTWATLQVGLYLEQHIMTMNANEAHNKGFFNYELVLGVKHLMTKYQEHEFVKDVVTHVHSKFTLPMGQIQH
jgi:hypothetical protein